MIHMVIGAFCGPLYQYTQFIAEGAILKYLNIMY